MKLSALIAPLLDAKADHETIRAVVLAFEAEQSDALEQRRRADAERQARKRSRDVTLRLSDRVLVRGDAHVEDKTLTSENPQKAESKKVTARGTRLPDDFEPDWEFAPSLGLTRSQAEAEFAKFRDFWTAKSGQGAAKLDWQATWRNWVRTAAERLPKARAGPQPRIPQMADIMAEVSRKSANGQQHDIEGSSGTGAPVPRLSAA